MTTPRYAPALLLAICSPLAAAPPPADPAPAGAPRTSPPEPTTPDASWEGPGEERWRLQAEPSVWYVAPSGEIRLPGTPTSSPRFRTEDVNLDSPRISPFAELHAGLGEWRLHASGMVFGSDTNAVNPAGFRVGPIVLSPGEAFRTSLDFATVEFTAGRAVQKAIESEDFSVDLEAFAGVRFWELDFNVTTATQRDQTDEFFIEPLAGAKLTMELAKNFTVDAVLSMGGMSLDDRETLSWDVVAGFTWRPVPHLGVQVGYRQLAFNLESDGGDDEFAWTGALAGLYAGVQIRF